MDHFSWSHRASGGISVSTCLTTSATPSANLTGVRALRTVGSRCAKSSHLAVPPELKAAALSALSALSSSTPIVTHTSVATGVAGFASATNTDLAASCLAPQPAFTPWASLIWESLHAPTQAHAKQQSIASDASFGAFSISSLPARSGRHTGLHTVASDDRNANTAPSLCGGGAGSRCVSAVGYATGGSDVGVASDVIGANFNDCTDPGLNTPEFLRGIREDLCVEQRHQSYPRESALHSGMQLCPPNFLSGTADLFMFVHGV